MSGHIVVTGCTGFIASHLTDRLLADGQTVVRMDSFIQSYVCVLPLSVAGLDVCMAPNRR